MANTLLDTTRRVGQQRPQAPAFMRQSNPTPVKPTPGPIEAAKKPQVAPTPTMLQMQFIDPLSAAERDATPRMVTEADIYECVPWTVKKLSATFPRLDEQSMVRFAKQNLNNSRVKFFRTANTWGAFECINTFYEPELIVRELWFVSRKATFVEIVNLLRAFELWAISINAISFRLGMLPGIDIGAFAKRLDGFEPINYMYEKKLR
jgi:hypothetical protein